MISYIEITHIQTMNTFINSKHAKFDKNLSSKKKHNKIINKYNFHVRIDIFCSNIHIE